MEKILRQCYKQRVIMGNSIVFQKRITSIGRIIENGLDDIEWEKLAKWMLGIGDKDTEDILIRLEEDFCQEDPDFSIDNNSKELKILVGVLVYEYSKNEENSFLPMMVICRCHSESNVICEYLYQLFVEYINEMRLSIRHHKSVADENYSIGISELKKSVAEKRKKAEEEDTNFAYGSVEMDSIVKLLEACENKFKYLIQKEKYLFNELYAQKEETNIAWWLLNGWSESYDCSFSELKVEEAALAIPLELYDLSQYILGPYAARPTIYKGLSNCKKWTANITLENFVSVVKDKAADLIDIEKMKLGQAQPILLALKCMNECKESPDEQAWTTVFEGRSRRKATDFKMSAGEFAYQLYLELELSYLKE